MMMMMIVILSITVLFRIRGLKSGG